MAGELVSEDVIDDYLIIRNILIFLVNKWHEIDINCVIYHIKERQFNLLVLVRKLEVLDGLEVLHF